MSAHRPSLTSPKRAFGSLSPAVWRASTVVFDNLQDFVDRKHRQPDGFSYGVTGTPTSRALEDRIAQLEGANHCVITPSGAAALMTCVMGFVRGGDHLLVSAACYGSLQAFCEKWLARMGVEVELYAPSIGADIAKQFRPNTRMICIEAPGSNSMEMCDVPAIAAAARAHGVLTMMDNTWASPLGFQPLAQGVDFSVEAATKFFSGHSDVLMGAISMNDPQHYAVLRDAQSTLGQQVSPDDCFLVMRGLETYPLRWKAQSASTFAVAQWLQAQPLVERLLYPPLETDPGHAIWRRDFRTCGCLFSMQLKAADENAYKRFFDALEHIAIGASWGGVHSLAAYYPASLQASRKFPITDKPLVRLAIGLEDIELIKQDLECGFAAFSRATG